MYWFPNTKEDSAKYGASDIIENSSAFLHKWRYSGIYFLIHDEEIVYVGQSVDVKSRLDQHSRGDDVHDPKLFNRYFVIMCDTSELNNLEAYYINKFHPKYNIAIPKFGGEL